MSIAIEILNYNYWEHFKFEKELAFVLPVEHPKRLLIRKTCNELLDKINNTKHEQNRKKNKTTS